MEHERRLNAKWYHLMFFWQFLLFQFFNDVLTVFYRVSRSAKPFLLKSIVKIFSSNNLTQGEHKTLPCGFHHHIPTNINRNNVRTEFESFSQNLLYNLSDMLENKISKVKTKLRNTCEKCRHVKVAYKQQKIIK